MEYSYNFRAINLQNLINQPIFTGTEDVDLYLENFMRKTAAINMTKSAKTEYLVSLFSTDVSKVWEEVGPITTI